MTDCLHVAVLMGGWSAERPVSLVTGRACAKALKTLGHSVTCVDVDRNICQTLSALKPDVAFNALHGAFGEDGCIQGILEILGIPYTHSGVLASALAMNKQQAKTVMKASDIPVAESFVLPLEDILTRPPLDPPYVIKPFDDGSSFGIYFVFENDEGRTAALIRSQWTYGTHAMIERYVAGRELTCAVMNNEALGVIEIIPRTQFYDYEAKYAPEGSKHVLPAKIKPKIYQDIRTIAQKVHQTFGCRGVSRSDFRWDDTPEGTKELVCLEVNTQPGMTDTSLVPEMAAHAGYSFCELVDWLIQDASLRR